jgi:hypothetical protein
MNLFRVSNGLRSFATSWIAVVTLASCFTLVQAPPVSAAPCLEEVAGDSDLSCTSNDVRLASVEVLVIQQGCEFEGDEFTFDGLLNVETNATTRYDIAYFIGDDPLESPDDDCIVATLDPLESGDSDGDACGDVTNAAAIPVSLTAKCVDGDGDGFFDISACSVWDNNMAGTCNGPEDVGPGTGAKCNCQIVNTDTPVPFCESNADCADADTNACTDNICDRDNPDADSFGCIAVNNTAGCDDGIFCNGTETCSAGNCLSSGDPCDEGPVCGNTCNEEADNCFAPQGTVCRGATGVCDVAEVCTGSSSSCPGNEFRTTVCRAAGGICDVSESCNGSTADCPADGFAGTSLVCRASGGICDVAENCTGNSAACPANSFLNSMSVCRASGGVCDVAENCTGNSATCPGNTFLSTMTVCRAQNGICDVAENCTGNSATCPGNTFASTTLTCRGSNGVCDAAERCTGTSGSCPADSFVEVVCRAANGICDVAETCTGSNPVCPADTFRPTSFTCRASGGICDIAEQCTGNSGSCPANTFRDDDTVCRTSGGVCDVAEECTGSTAACPANDFIDEGTVCRGSGGVCDVAEECTGSTASCPGNDFLDEATTCRSAAGICDTAEVCAGTGASCPADEFLTVVCRSVAGVCDTAETCTGNEADCPADEFLTTECRSVAGVCDTAETCTGNEAGCPADLFLTTECRSVAGVCDTAETCTGAEADCPADQFLTTTCRANAGVCDTEEVCTGSAAACPAEGFLGTTTVCRATTGVCDTLEVCSGSAASCPGDVFLTSPCRASAGVCDNAEICTGSSGACPADGFKPSTTTCRADAGDCDVAEQCTGAAAACPANGFEPQGTACATDDNLCTNDVCNSNGVCQHNNNTIGCDDGLFCTINDKCGGGECDGTPNPCGDGVQCTVDSCNEATDSCVNSPSNARCDDENSCTVDVCVAGDGCTNTFSCIDICRPATFYSKRVGLDDNLLQDLLDAVGGLEVCGRTITETANAEEPFLSGLGLASALEGLCVRLDNEVPERELYRELVTAALNCAMSGSDNCDEVVDDFIDVSFSECSDLCAGETSDGDVLALAETCTHQLGCYNRGGRLIGDRCAFGTCDVTEQLCGGDYGPCPPVTGVPVPLLQVCERFPDNCRDENFCQPALDICPDRARPSGSRACKEAKKNDCAIDFCSIDDD